MDGQVKCGVATVLGEVELVVGEVSECCVLCEDHMSAHARISVILRSLPSLAICRSDWAGRGPVSYTHLTLPTILLV